MRRFAWLALACALAAPAVRATEIDRPYTIETVLSLESLGRVAFTPDGRWLLYEVRGSWSSAGQYDLGWLTPQRTSRLFVVDLLRGGAPRPLLTPKAGAGDMLGEISPDGRRAIVYRLIGPMRELGVVDLATGRATWSGLSVEPEVWSAQARWRDNKAVVALAASPQTPSRVLGQGWQTQERTSAAWSAAKAGRLAVTALGGGPRAGANPPPSSVGLVVIDAGSGHTRRVATGPFTELSLSPDGARAALIAEGETTPVSAVSVVQTSVASRRQRLVLVDVATGAIQRPCPDCDLVPHLLSWSADSRELLICARQNGDAYDWNGLRYWRVAASGAARLAAPDLVPGTAFNPTVSDLSLVVDAGWVGKSPAILARSSQAKTADLTWWRIDEDGPRPLITGLSGVGAKRLAEHADGFVVRTPSGLVAAAPEGVRSVASADAKAFVDPPLPGDMPNRIRIATPRGARVLTANGVSSAAALLPDGAVALAQSPAGPVAGVAKTDQGVSTLLLAAPGQAARSLVTLNAGLAALDQTTPRTIIHTTPEGRAVKSWLYLPAGGKAERAADLPLVVVPYPGAVHAAAPAPSSDQVGFSANIRVMTGAGYAVLIPSLPLAANAPPNQGMAAAMLSAVDAALAAEPRLSRTRLALWGQSFGGYGVLAAATQSTRFKAVIASAPITDFLSFYGSLKASNLAMPEATLFLASNFGLPETGQGRLGGPPWSAIDRYVAASPVLAADKITAPVMLIQGDLDMAPGQSVEMFNALYRQGKAVDLLYYYGEGHVITSPANVRDLYARAFAFLQAALTADVSPAVAPPPMGGDDTGKARASQPRAYPSSTAAQSSSP